MRFPLIGLVSILAVGCMTTSDQSACKNLCDTLVRTCRYEAFPDYGSCEQGCGYEANEGGSVVSMSECVADAGCNTFEILECQNAFGLAQD